MLSSIDIDQLLNELKESEEEIDFSNSVSDIKEINDLLVDEIILAIYVSDIEEAYFMTFELEGGNLVSFKVEGDCCSTSWFADFFNVGNIINQPILGVSEIDLEEFGYQLQDGRGKQDDDKIYGYKIYTKDHVGVFSFRNSSNGYYGGWLEITSNHTDRHLISNKEHWVSSY